MVFDPVFRAIVSGNMRPCQILCKKNKALPNRQDFSQGRTESKCIYYGKNIKRTAEGVCKQSAIHKHNRYYEQYEGAVQRCAANGDGGGA